MAIARPAAVVPEMEAVSVRKIDLHDLRIALDQGWKDFLDLRGDLVFIGLIYPAVVVLAIIYAFQQSILPLIFPLVAGSILFGPAVAAGFYELARRREQGLDTRYRHFLDVMRGPAAFSLFALSTMLFLLFMFWIIAAWLIYVSTLGTAVPEAARSLPTFLKAVFSTPAGWKMIVAGNLVGMVFVVLALAFSVVSFPMVVDRPVSAGDAMRTSFAVARKSPVAVAVWGLIVVAMLVIGSLPAFIGLAVVLPVLGYSTWHLYTRAVSR
ncbi:MAG: DUF2189 domain-containing protein [Novosphingobium sp.]